MRNNMKKKLKLKFILIIFFSILTAIAAVFFVGKYIVTLKYVKFEADFDLDKKKLLQYLEIESDKGVLNYNVDSMKEKLSKLLYLKSYDVYLRNPNTLVINLQIRRPVAKVVGENNNLYFIDETGFVYREVQNDYEKTPTLIFSGGADKIKIGVIISGKYKNLLYELTLLKSNYSDIYDSISQFEVFGDAKDDVIYKIYFKTINHCIYLKNIINVDCISKGLAGAMYFDKINRNDKKLFYTKNAFEIM